VSSPTLNPQRIIGVIGAGACDEHVAARAFAVGEALAAAGCTLVCGGLGGVMTAACRGARSRGGHTIGILPGDSAADANEWVETAIPTGLGVARNVIIVRTARALIAVDGGPGTLSEIAFALQLGVPVVSLGSWEISPEIISAESAEEAVARALELADARSG